MDRRLRQRPIAFNHGRQVNPAAIALNKGPQAAPVALRVEEKAAVLFTAQQPWKIWGLPGAVYRRAVLSQFGIFLCHWMISLLKQPE